MNKDIKHSRENALLSGLVFSTGLGVCGLSFLIENAKFSTILLGVGCSIIASGVVAGIAARYLVDVTFVQNIIRNWGLVDIYKFRSQKNEYINSLICSSNSMDICGYGLNSLRENIGDEILGKVKRGFLLRIVTYDPNSVYVEKRERELREAPGAIKKSIENCIDWVEELRENAPNENNVMVHLYDGLHFHYYQKVGSRIFVGPYLSSRSGQQTITFEFKENSLGYDYFKNIFESTWSELEEGNENVR